MKIHFIEGIKYKGVRCFQASVMTEDGEKRSFPFGWGLYVNHGNGRKDIVIAKQKSVFGTLEILIHELGHWILDYIPIITNKQWEALNRVFPSNLFGRIKKIISRMEGLS